jgi:hypothetical protein
VQHFIPELPLGAAFRLNVANIGRFRKIFKAKVDAKSKIKNANGEFGSVIIIII